MSSFPQKLRKEETDTEKRLWYHLRSKKFEGLKFRRQEPIRNYIVDFVCFEKKVIIECDGSQHLRQMTRDKIRDQFFVDQGFKVLRFWDNEVLQNTDIVLEMIYQACQTPPSP